MKVYIHYDFEKATNRNIVICGLIKNLKFGLNQAP